MKCFDPDFYRHHLLEEILPFWEAHSFDAQEGGFLTCFKNDGSELVSHDKYTWSQGRMVWVLSNLVTGEFLAGERRDEAARRAASGAKFLRDHCILPDSSCVYLTDRQGRPKAVNGKISASIYADCFAILGLSAYGCMAGCGESLDTALAVYQSVLRRYRQGDFSTEPYPIPGKLLAHGVPMILTNTARTLHDNLAAAGHPRQKEVAGDSLDFARYTLESFHDGNGFLHEYVGDEAHPDALLTRYINPGHTLEDLWFMLAEFIPAGDTGRIATCMNIMRATLGAGWDEAHGGGLTHFADPGGGPPQGTPEPYEKEGMTGKVQSDWGSKLWWVHSEAIYATMLAYALTGEEDFAQWCQRLFDYTFASFPNKLNDRGEWIQILDREGRPEDRIVALPVKDPFHIQRNLILIIQLLESDLWKGRE